MEYTVREVCDRRSMKDFLGLPRRIYCNDPFWVQPLDSEIKRVLNPRRNPYFANALLALFVCYAGQRAVARTALIVNNQHYRKFGVRAGFYGFFESVDDSDAVRSLFRAVVAKCHLSGVDVLEGPFNPNHYSELGIQVDRFDAPTAFFQTHNPPYYPRLLVQSGFRAAAELFTARNDNAGKYVEERYGPVAQTRVAGDFAVRHPDLKYLKRDLEVIRSVFNDAFSSNWHFLEVTPAEYRFSAKYLAMVTEPELITIVEYQGHPVGVLMCVLDINPLLQRLHGKIGPFSYLRFRRDRSKVNRLIVYAVGIRKQFQRTCVYRLLLDAMCRTARKFDVVETTWMSRSNPLAIHAAERLGMKEDKHFVIYALQLKVNGGTE